MSKDGSSIKVTINKTIVDQSYVRGFSVHNKTGKHLAQVIYYQKPSLIPECGYEYRSAAWCNTEYLPNVTTAEKFIKLNVSLTAGPLADINFWPFTVLLNVDGRGNFDVNPLVCSVYLNHTVKVEGKCMDSEIIKFFLANSLINREAFI